MKTIVKPKIATNEQELKEALDSQATVILIENPLYSSIVDKVRKANTGRIMNGSGIAAFLMGLLVVSGPLAWVMLLGGAAVGALGSSMDSLKDYSVKIDEVRSQILLYRTKGKNRYKPTKHEISNI